MRRDLRCGPAADVSVRPATKEVAMGGRDALHEQLEGDLIHVVVHDDGVGMHEVALPHDCDSYLIPTPRSE
jgi:hypothetical protein